MAFVGEKTWALRAILYKIFQKKKYIFIHFFCFGLLSGNILSAAASPGKSHQEKAGRSVAAKPHMSHSDWSAIMTAYAHPDLSRQKLFEVYQQLKRYSGKNFEIYPYQTNRIGLAKPGGKIIIDVSVVGQPIEILAFWLAHEWAHQDLGHAMNRFSTPQMAVNALRRRQRFPTANEDEADIWASRFMAKNHYPIGGLLEYICGMKEDHTDRSHSSWKRRAQNIARTYQNMTGKMVAFSCKSTLGSYQKLVAQNMRQSCQACRTSLFQMPARMAAPFFVQWCMSTCKVRQ